MSRTIKHRLAFDLVRGIKVFLNLEAGVTRGGTAPGDGSPGTAWKSPHAAEADSSESASLRRKLEDSQRKLEEVRWKMAKKDKLIERLRAQPARQGDGQDAAGFRPENIIWIFGTGRSGSTWLASMMGDLQGYDVWNEPLVGALFGNFYYERSGHRAEKGGKYFILGRRYRETWIKPLRDLVLGGAAARFAELVDDGYLVIKEPNGSVGAPLLMEALPESRMILLVRDPRDVVASSIDSRREGSWRYQRREKSGDEKIKKAASKVADEAAAFVRGRSMGYAQAIGNAKQAYDAHRGRKVLVRYEDLRADTLGTMKRIYTELGIEVDQEELAKAVHKHSWENIPEEEKGEGKFYRKAKPGGWREDLTPEQIQIVEEVTAPLLREFYAGS